MVDRPDVTWTPVVGEWLEEATSFRAVAGETSAPFLPWRFVWRGRAREVVSATAAGRRIGPSFETAAQRYLRGHRALVRTADGVELLVEGERRTRRTTRWRVLAWRDPRSPSEAPPVP